MRRTLVAALITVAGVALFVQSVRAVGAAHVVDGLQRTGWSFLAIVALGGSRHVMRVLAWAWCVEPGLRLPIVDAVRGSLAGDALGNLTPLGLAITEPTKAVWVKREVPVVTAAAALMVENVIYAASVLPILLGGTLALPWVVRASPAVRWASVGMLAGSGIAVAAVAVAIRKKWRVLDRAITLLVMSLPHRLGRPLASAGATARELEEAVHRVRIGGAVRVLGIVCAEATYHLSAVLEVYVTLAVIGAHVTLFNAFMLEYVNRVITIAFKFMPMRVGVDEAGTGVAASLLGLGASTGVTLAVVRKARILCWTLVGLGFLSGRVSREVAKR